MEDLFERQDRVVRAKRRGAPLSRSPGSWLWLLVGVFGIFGPPAVGSALPLWWLGYRTALVYVSGFAMACALHYAYLLWTVREVLFREDDHEDLLVNVSTDCVEWRHPESGCLVTTSHALAHEGSEGPFLSIEEDDRSWLLPFDHWEPQEMAELIGNVSVNRIGVCRGTRTAVVYLPGEKPLDASGLGCFVVPLAFVLTLPVFGVSFAGMQGGLVLGLSLFYLLGFALMVSLAVVMTDRLAKPNSVHFNADEIVVRAWGMLDVLEETRFVSDARFDVGDNALVITDATQMLRVRVRRPAVSVVRLRRERDRLQRSRVLDA